MEGITLDDTEFQLETYLLEIEASSSHPWGEKGCHLLIQGTLGASAFRNTNS